MNDNEKVLKLSGEVLRFCRNTIILNLRFMDSALSRLKPAVSAEIPFGTDGKHLAYSPKYVLKRYAENSNLTVRDYLHTVLHCVFRHNFVSTAINRKLWNISCDIAVESIIDSFSAAVFETPSSKKHKQICARLEKAAGMLTAEKLYRYFCDNEPSQTKLDELSGIFSADDHRLWYMTDDEKESIGAGDNGSNPDESNESNDGNDGSGTPDNDDSEQMCSEQDWKGIAERMQVDMETLSQKQGEKAGSLLQELRAVNRERYDYGAFLKKFAVMGEAMQVNDDEFDYVFYTYGLKLYKNMPLIEPLEYKEVKRIREFVIAVDTSGSVSGELVQTFLKKTYNILQQTESFFSRINLHIIQCDAEIQEHIKITSREEFDRYLETMVIRGLGGTDFRPVFDAVNELIAKKEFTNLKGMIYFTDGYGTFPSKKPAYETAFVFIKEDFFNADVPTWAIKLILHKDEI